MKGRHIMADTRLCRLCRLNKDAKEFSKSICLKCKAASDAKLSALRESAAASHLFTQAQVNVARLQALPVVVVPLPAFDDDDLFGRSVPETYGHMTTRRGSVTCHCGSKAEPGEGVCARHRGTPSAG